MLQSRKGSRQEFTIRCHMSVLLRVVAHRRQHAAQTALCRIRIRRVRLCPEPWPGAGAGSSRCCVQHRAVGVARVARVARVGAPRLGQARLGDGDRANGGRLGAHAAAAWVVATAATWVATATAAPGSGGLSAGAASAWVVAAEAGAR